MAKFHLLNTEKDSFYIVGSTKIRIGKGKSTNTYSGYKHHHGVKFQVIINDKNYIKAVRKAYPSSIHDKKIFIKEYELAYKKDKITAKSLNKELSSKRIKIEHLFANMKNFRILQRLNYYKINKIEIFFNAIANIYNLSKG